MELRLALVSVLLVTRSGRAGDYGDDSANGRDPASNQLLNYSLTHPERLTLTTSFGTAVDDKTNSITAGPRGPVVLQDTVLIDELQHFNRQRIPERSVHAKGAGAHGYFQVTNDITRYTKAWVFSKVGLRTPTFIRFSTVGGDVGSADTIRDIRGFSLKFYTYEGIWDLVGLNSPIFFIRDPILFPSLIHAQQRNQVTFLKDPDMFWDFHSLISQATHQVMILYSDRGIPDGYRHMNGYGVHAFKLVNSVGAAVYCKFHFETNQGIKNLPESEASKIASADPDYGVRDLYNSIAKGNFPSWNVSIQIMTFDDAEKFRWNPFDATKLWPETDFPLRPLGKLVLNENVGSYFAEIEQVGFDPAHMVPGIEPSPDKLLHGRLFAYSDAQMYRTGINSKQLPINKPPPTIANSQRDGRACYGDNQNGAPNYYPSSFGNVFTSRQGALLPYPNAGDVRRYNTTDDDNFSQPGTFWRKVLTQPEKERMVNSIVASLGKTAKHVQEQAVYNFYQVDKTFGTMVQDGLNKFVASRK